MPDANQVALPWLEWLLGIGATLVTAAFGHVHIRIGNIERRARSDVDQARGTIDQSLLELRGVLEQRALIDREFREHVLRDMVTKGETQELRTAVYTLAGEMRQAIGALTGRSQPPTGGP